MKKIEIKCYYNDEVLFVHECKDNDMSKTLRAAAEGNVRLHGADLRGWKIIDVDMKGIFMQSCVFTRSELRHVSFLGCELSMTDFRDCFLQHCDFGDAYMQSSSFAHSESSLCRFVRTDLEDANLCFARFSGCELQDVRLKGSNVTGFELHNSEMDKHGLKKLHNRLRIVPEEGAFIGFADLVDGCVAKVLIPAEAGRFTNLSQNNSKSCAEYVKTLNIWDANRNEIKKKEGLRGLFVVGKTTHSEDWHGDPTKGYYGCIDFYNSRSMAESLIL